jgi:hypothetical protein
MEWSKTVEILTDLVSNFGPYAYSILFLFVVSVWCNKQYQKATAKATASLNEIQTYRWFFIGAFALGCLLSVYSVIWWSWTRTQSFVFTVEISGVDQSHTVKPAYPLISKGNPVQDQDDTKRYEFVAISDGPFTPAQSFTISLAVEPLTNASGIGPARQNLQLVYHGRSVDRYRIQMDGDHLSLKPID